jgi:general secretion pathway protein C
MQTHSPSLGLWRQRIVTFVVAALAAASATLWTLKGTNTATSPAAGAVIQTETRLADPATVGRLLGGGQPSAPSVVVDSAASHFKLTGVVADRAQGGYALIAVDGQPAKPFRVGARLNEALVLHSVTARSAALAASKTAPVSVTLDLPKLTPL